MADLFKCRRPVLRTWFLALELLTVTMWLYQILPLDNSTPFEKELTFLKSVRDPNYPSWTGIYEHSGMRDHSRQYHGPCSFRSE